MCELLALSAVGCACIRRYRLEIVKLFCDVVTHFSAVVHEYLCATEVIPIARLYNVIAHTALDISTGPLARHTFQTTGPVRASTFYLSLARTGHLDIRRATRFQIVLARTMTIHSMYFSRGRPSHISAVFAQPFCYSETPACRESESGMSIKYTDVSV